MTAKRIIPAVKASLKLKAVKKFIKALFSIKSVFSACKSTANKQFDK
jgi:hypothetical protein